MATGYADDDGRVSLAAVLPSDAQTGRHDLVVSGVDTSGRPRTVARPTDLRAAMPWWFTASSAQRAWRGGDRRWLPAVAPGPARPMAVDGLDMTCKCSAWLHYWARAGRGVWDWLWTRFAVDRLTTEVAR